MQLIIRATILTTIVTLVTYLVVRNGKTFMPSRLSTVGASVVDHANFHADALYGGASKEVHYYHDDQVAFKESRFNYLDPVAAEEVSDGENSLREFMRWPWQKCDEGTTAKPGWCRQAHRGIFNEIYVAVKMSAADDKAKIQTLLKTTLGNVPKENVVIFSDLVEHIHGHDTLDIIAQIPEKERLAMPEYKTYQAIQKRHAVSGEEVRALNKYKSIPMTTKMWEMQVKKPKKWLFFIEANTLVFWDNLLFWLNHFDPQQALYLGSPVYSDGGEYGHQDAGYLLSSAALSKFMEVSMITQGSANHISQRGYDIASNCCGDKAIAHVLREKDIHLRGYGPMFNDRGTSSLGFNGGTWCEPILTLSTTSADEMQKTFDFAKEWKTTLTRNERPMIFRDLFTYIQPSLAISRDAWRGFEPEKRLIADNQVQTFENLEQCRSYCQSDRKCMQFDFYNNTCAISYDIRLGQEAGEDVKSGWKLGRLNSWAKVNQCKSPHWVRQFPPWLGDQGFLE